PGGARVSRASCRADERASDYFLRLLRHLALEAGAWASQPKGAGELGTNGANRRALAAACPGPSSLSAATLHRQTPKVGAESVSSARSDLSGGARGNPRPG